MDHKYVDMQAKKGQYKNLTQTEIILQTHIMSLMLNMCKCKCKREKIYFGLYN